MIIFQHNKLDKWRRDTKKISFFPFHPSHTVYKHCTYVHTVSICQVLSHLSHMTRTKDASKASFSSLSHFLLCHVSRDISNKKKIQQVFYYIFIYSHNNNHFFQCIYITIFSQPRSCLCIYYDDYYKQLPIDLHTLKSFILFLNTFSLEFIM